MEYQPVHKQTKTGISSCHQQVSLLLQQGVTDPSPRQQFKQDLSKLVSPTSDSEDEQDRKLTRKSREGAGES